MEEILQRFVHNFLGRLDGPFHFRFIFQPLMAVIFAIIGGIKDAKSGRLPYNVAILTHPELRRELIKSGWKDVGKVFIIAIILDVVYQLRVLHMIYPVETLVTAVVLALVPYLLLRGPVNRLMRLIKKDKHA